MKAYFCRSRIFNSILADLIFFLILATLAFVLRKVAIMGGMIYADVNWPQHYTYEALLWSLVLLSVIVLPLRIKPLISNRVLAYIGEISYSFYLIHLPVMFYINMKFLPVQSGFTPIYFGKLLLILVVTLILSSLSYRFIEKPFLRIKDRL
jgi:peptidoglycan/LPS O-acetylase OafA/YrhL